MVTLWIILGVLPLSRLHTELITLVVLCLNSHKFDTFKNKQYNPFFTFHLDPFQTLKQNIALSFALLFCNNLPLSLKYQSHPKNIHQHFMIYDVCVIK